MQEELDILLKSKSKKRKKCNFVIALGCLVICILTAAAITGAFGHHLKEASVIDDTEAEPEETGGSQEEEMQVEEIQAEEIQTEEIQTEEVADSDEAETENATDVLTEEEQLEAKVAEKVDAMTLEQKVAQLFIITPEALTGYNVVTAAGEKTREALAKHPVGGLVFFAQNLVEEGQLKEMTGNLQDYAQEIQGMPLFLCIDEEGGIVARMGNHDNFQVPQIPDMAEIGAGRDCNAAREAGREIGAYLAEYGFNVDFAPVADVLTNPENTVIGVRSFGTDAGLVSDMSLAFADGLEQQGVYSCMKHFPGHGATSGDTHDGYSYTQKTLEELKEQELVPFQAGIEEGIPFLMASHISVPGITGTDEPTSLSGKMLTGVLRENMGYDGIVVTDAMNMGAIANQYSSGEAAIKALEAGADMILMPVDFETAYQSVLEACQSGRLTEERLNQSLMRILRKKVTIQS